MHQEAKEPIKLYLDGASEPFKVAHPPLRFQFTTLHLPDGPHVLRVEASNGLAPATIKEIPFTVRNGVALSVSGLEPNQTIAGQVDVIINAYAGNTEVDFEPKRAETPEPVPTWAWVLLLAVGAWSLSYLLSPVESAREERPGQQRDLASIGARVYGDACARCHGEDGNGALPTVPALRDSTKAIAESPYSLLSFLVTSAPNSMMPAWGTRLTNEELVAVVNFVRTSWRHDSSTIDLVHRSPPKGPFRMEPRPGGTTQEVEHGIRALEAELLTALRTKNTDVLGQCCFPTGSAPVLFRTDGIFARGTQKVAEAWTDYFAALGKGEVTRLQLIDTRYSYDKEQVDGAPQDGANVIAMGRLFLATKNAQGREETAKGRFIRVYQYYQGAWALVFDFADIPMSVGCTVDEVPCPPESVPTPGRPNDLGFLEAMKMLKDLRSPGGSSPHGPFWKDLSYVELTSGTFEDLEQPGTTYRFLIPWNSRESNLIRALRDGKGCVVRLKDGTLARRDLARMPKGKPAVPAELIARLEAWIDAGCPELLGTPSSLPKEQIAFPPEAGGMPPTPAPPVAPPPTPPQPTPPQPTPPVAPPPTPVAGTGKTSPLGYAEVQAILGSWMRSAASAPHQDFWSLPYAEFMTFTFPRTDGEDGQIRLLVPGDSAKSNLLRALVDGKGILVTYKDGRTEEVEIKRMPPRGKTKPTPEQLAQIALWIDAGCPEVAGGPAYGGGGAPPAPAPTPAPTPAPAPAPAPAPTPPPEAAPAPAPAPAPAVEGPVIGFAEVQSILGSWMRSAPSAPHQDFWTLPYTEFMGFTFPRTDGEDGTIALLVPGDSAKSNLIRGLRDGKGILVTYGDGRTAEVEIKRMPPRGKKKPTEEEIAKLAKWIDAGCPEQGRP